MSTAVAVTTIPRIKHVEAMQITAVENRKFCCFGQSAAERLDQAH
jgi:hypothetical protein